MHHDLKNIIHELADKILHYKKKYYSGSPEISDAEFDQLEIELKNLDPEHPILSLVGAEPKGNLPKIAHESPMLSLEKTYVEEDLYSWSGSEPVVGTLKIDGNSVSLIYEKGIYKLAKTRGNGRIGEDVSNKIPWVQGIPTRLMKTDLMTPTPQIIEVRGELYCDEEGFARLAEEMESLKLEAPTNPRNIVAGILGRKQYLHLAQYFKFMAFDVLCEGRHRFFKSEMDKLDWLRATGFDLPRPRLLFNSNEVRDYLNFVQETMAQGSLGIDGGVFTYNRLALHEELGATVHHPRYRISFKWAGETAVSRIREIQWATSRLGVVTPVAVIEPVFLSGANLTNITLHNAAHVKAYHLKPGDQIEILRSGEVIPKFLRVVESSPGEVVLLKVCPSCGSTLKFDEVRLICENHKACPAQQLGTLINWIVSVEIDDLNEKRLSPLVELGLVKHISDLYRLTREDFLTLPLTKEKMATRLYDNIQKSKQVPLARFLMGLGIGGTGLATWEKILRNFPSLEAVLSIEPRDLIQLDGFAEKSASQIVEGLKDRKSDIARLLQVGVSPFYIPHQPKKTSLTGKTFVITGTLSRPREELIALIIESGGAVAGSVTKKTHALIIDDVNSTSSKAQKARQLGILMWSEESLLEQIQG